ncbi:MAG: hypothetical protein WC985_11300 [Thermoplasmata archaeon]
MAECTSALIFLDEILRLIAEADGDGGEHGFVACEKDHGLSIGSRCSDPGNHCTVKAPVCPEGHTPAFSFHTHSTKPTLIDIVAGDNPFLGEAAKVALLPSTKDLAADADVGSKFGCVGGKLNDKTRLLWCFRSFAGAGRTPVDLDTARNRVEALQERLSVVLKEDREKRDVGLLNILADYFTGVGTPCLELRLPE